MKKVGKTSTRNCTKHKLLKYTEKKINKCKNVFIIESMSFHRLTVLTFFGPGSSLFLALGPHFSVLGAMIATYPLGSLTHLIFL
jgi:hypothetical protein